MPTSSLISGIWEAKLYFPFPRVWADLVTYLLQRVCGRSDGICFQRLGQKWHCSFFFDFSLWSLALEKANCHVVKTLKQPSGNISTILVWFDLRIILSKWRLFSPSKLHMVNTISCVEPLSAWEIKSPQIQNPFKAKQKNLCAIGRAWTEGQANSIVARDYKSLLASTGNQSAPSESAFNKGFHCTGGSGKLYRASDWCASNSLEPAARVPFNSF